MQIRKMIEADLQAVAELERKIFSNPWSRKSFSDALASSDNCYLTALQEDEVVGYCGLWCSCECADLCNLAVSGGHRRQGLARELLRLGFEEVREKGVYRVLLEVRRSNASAIALYDGLGFEQIGVRRGYYSDPVEDGILMEKILPHGEMDGCER